MSDEQVAMRDEDDDGIPSLIQRSDLTRELWSKYEWIDVGTNGDPNLMVRGRIRLPSDARSAWNEFDIFEQLWKVKK